MSDPLPRTYEEAMEDPHAMTGDWINADSSFRALCVECGTSWDVLEKAPECHKDGHHHELRGVPITYVDHELLPE